MLNVQFINLSGIDEKSIFITPYSDSGMPYDVQFKDDNGVLKPFNKKESQALGAFMKNGLQINNIDAGRFYISFGKAWASRPPGQTPSAVAPQDDWFTTQWDKFEITMNNNDGDQANLTSIDFVGIPMQLETRDAANKLIKIFGYPTGNKVISKLADKNARAIVTDNGQLDGKIVRVNGPAQSGYPSTGGWPRLANYIAALKTANQSTQILGEISISVDEATNWRFQYDFQVVVNQQDNGMTMTGTLTANNTVVPPDQPATDPVFIKSDPLTITFAPDTGEKTFMSSFIYAGVGNTEAGISNVNFTGNWEDFFEKTISKLQLTALLTAHSQFNELLASGNFSKIETAIKSFNDAISAFVATKQNLLTNVQKHVIGDLATGFAYGFLGSEQFKDKPSKDWFAEGQKLVLSDLQPNNPFYSVFEKIIFDEAIEHRIYGHPYSDRLKAYEVAGNVVKSGDTKVDTLVITILGQENTTGLQKQKVDSIVGRLRDFLKSIFKF